MQLLLESHLTPHCTAINEQMALEVTSAPKQTFSLQRRVKLASKRSPKINFFLVLPRRKQDEVRILEDTIRLRSEAQRKKGIEMDSTCHICLKTKFADGVGHLCNYCGIRCCARCGGKVSLRSNKVRLSIRSHSPKGHAKVTLSSKTKNFFWRERAKRGKYFFSKN